MPQLCLLEHLAEAASAANLPLKVPGAGPDRDQGRWLKGKEERGRNQTKIQACRQGAEVSDSLTEGDLEQVSTCPPVTETCIFLHINQTEKHVTRIK